jgi:hypothetical protein
MVRGDGCQRGGVALLAVAPRLIASTASQMLRPLS